ncbi:MAG: LysE family translocator [Rhodobacteraceae bacterium]|nr:LysE family translocator [Paracoccaceae bacterium]
MPFDTLLPLTALLFAMVWTPGPNNAMLSASGAQFGYRATVPHILGVAFGFPLMLFAMAFGLGEIFLRSAIFQESLRWVGAALLLYVAWKIATSKRPGEAGARRRPFRFYEAVAFQWINPKAWAMAIGIVSTFVTGNNPLLEASIAAGIAAGAGITSANGWAWFGVWMQRWLNTALRFKIFNLIMAAMIVMGIALLFLDH